MSPIRRIAGSGTRVAEPLSAVQALGRWLLLALGLFLLFALLEDFSFFRVLDYQLSRRDIGNPEFSGWTYAIAYAVSYGTCLLAMLVLYTHSWAWLRYLSYLLTALLVAIFLGFKSTNGYGFTYHEASLVWSEPGNAGDALRHYAWSYALPVVGAFALVAGLAFVVRRWVPLQRSWLLLLLPPTAFYFGSALIEATEGKVYQLPIPYRLAVLTHYTYGFQMLYYGKREVALIEPTSEPLAEHIVFILDESVSGDLLGVNDPRFDTTPYLSSIEDRFLNYGVASAISNLTSTSNIVLQSGLRPDQFPDSALRSLKNPNLFHYMQRAGFRASLIDAQHYSERPWNFMTGFDLDELDEHVIVREQAAGTTTFDMDFEAIDSIERTIIDNERSFSFVVKTGAHVPYDDKYPPGEGGAALPRVDIPGRESTMTMTNYLRALRWTVDHFLEELLGRLERLDRRVIVVFTADHGQSIQRWVGDAPVQWTHADVVEPSPDQAKVPLFVFGLGPGTQDKLDTLFHPELRDRVSCFELFPSLLYLAGYDPDDIRQHYYHTLFEPSASREGRIFLSGNLFGMGAAFYGHAHVREAGYANPYPSPEPAAGSPGRSPH